jgi:hypothetical protein
MSKIQNIVWRAAPLTASLVFAFSVMPLQAQSHTGHGAAAPAASQPQAAQRQAANPTNYVQQLNAIFQRMMSDPVIRERVATDPVLQRMLQSAGVAQISAPPSPQGTNHLAMPSMHGMNHDSMQMPSGVTAQDQQQAFDFIVRLLADRAVAGEISDNDRLRRLWSDPDVQRRLAEMRSGSR